ncbi:glutathione S-transferase [Sphaerosporella brunnea]|uniref:glutathione transferase n=1 Tax=Sphaerosporella brunnea TaxID=1250544 RepID=A0A5J5EK82_9PEZI|nr:glutathione S-transferase [Sphaerosporella brunnea]
MLSIRSILQAIPKKPTLFIIEGRYQNWIKPLMLMEELGIDRDVICLPGVPAMKTEWYGKIHPQRMVPALVDELHGEKVTLWDSSSIMLYLTQRYDTERKWRGRNLAEDIEIWNWLIFETASLGPTAKYWVSYDLRAEPIPEVTARLHDDLRKQYDTIEARLREPGQSYLALKDRPTIADLSVLLFADSTTSKRMGFQLSEWPAIKTWSEKMYEFEGVRKAFNEKDNWKAVELCE